MYQICLEKNIVLCIKMNTPYVYEQIEFIHSTDIKIKIDDAI